VKVADHQNIGASPLRKEDWRLLTGRGRFVDDVQLPGTLYATVVRSPHPSAAIQGIDFSAALDIAGVVDVLTGADLGIDPPRIPQRLGYCAAADDYLQTPLARDFVRYVGDPVAVVLAKDRYIAADGAQAVQVSYRELPFVLDVAQATDLDAAEVHAGHANIMAELDFARGDVVAEFANADLVLNSEFSVQRHTAMPLEPRGLLADGSNPDIITVWGQTKVPHYNREQLALMLKIDAKRLHFVPTEIGGAFGVRGELYPEDYLVPFLALKHRRPVKWIESRSEHFYATNHSRQQSQCLEVAVRFDGGIRAVRGQIDVDMGAYARTHGILVPINTVALWTGAYDVPSFDLKVRAVMTHKTPIGTFRAPGRFESCFARERLIDVVARKLSLDPADVRRRNLLTSEQMPYDAGIGAAGVRTVITEGDFPALLDRALEDIRYKEVRRSQREWKRRGSALGLGLACFVEKSGRGGTEYAKAALSANGQLTVYAGGSNVGQGVETVLAQIAADALQTSYSSIDIVLDDTERVAHGEGSYASRTTMMAGGAVWMAAGRLASLLVEAAAALTDRDERDLALSDGAVRYKSSDEIAIDLGELARRWPGCLEAEHTFSAGEAYWGGVHAALVEVERDSGQTRILRYAIALDCGKAVNPRLVDAQVFGGFAQGVGGVLSEELVYRPDGKLADVTFDGYGMLHAPDLPTPVLRITEDYPNLKNPLGIKGIGEGGITGVSGALANAVADAIWHLRGDDTEAVRSLPLTPTAVLGLIGQVAPVTEREQS
jgi:carbon-monoxide dehydrogenase large subunit